MTPEIAAEIFRLLPNIPHAQIAQRVGVSRRTVLRIANGETWNEITQLPKRARPTPHRHDAQSMLVNDICAQVESQDALCMRLDSQAALCSHFGFAPTRPLQRGWFDSWDGRIHVVSDGVVAWVSKELYRFVGSLDEIPYFSLADLMDQPIGKPLTTITEFEDEGVACLNDITFIDLKFLRIAKNRGLTIRQVGDRIDYVFLTKARSRTTAGAFSGIHAAVATLDYL